MRKIFIALALALTASAAHAQTQQQIAQCNDPAATADQTIAGCGAMIAGGHLKGTDLSDALNNRADGYLGKGKWDLAIADLDRAIPIDPSNANALNNRCMANIGKALYDKAIDDCSKAIKLNSGYGHYYRNRAGAYLKKGKRTEALADYRQAIKLDPKDTFAMQGLMGMAARQSGETHQGEMPAKMKKALGIGTDLPDAAAPKVKVTH